MDCCCYGVSDSPFHQLQIPLSGSPALQPYRLLPTIQFVHRLGGSELQPIIQGSISPSGISVAISQQLDFVLQITTLSLMLQSISYLPYHPLLQSISHQFAYNVMGDHNPSLAKTKALPLQNPLLSPYPEEQTSHRRRQSGCAGIVWP